MNVLKYHSGKTAKVVFCSRMSGDTFDRKHYPTYAFKCDNSMASIIEPGDYVVVITAQGLNIGVFVEFSNKIADKEKATKNIVCKIPGYTVETKM